MDLKMRPPMSQSQRKEDQLSDNELLMKAMLDPLALAEGLFGGIELDDLPSKPEVVVHTKHSKDEDEVTRLF